jgi:hypothetical protein
MIPQSLHWPVNPFLTGGIIVLVGCVLFVIGAQIKRGNIERHRDRQYVKDRRGEDLPLGDPPKIAGLLEYLGGAVAFIGVTILVLAWSATAGQN